MALTINGATVLRAFADHPELYPAIQGDLAELARKMLLKQIKSPKLDAASFAKVWATTGADNMSIMLDAMSPSELAGLMKKVDPHSAHAKAGEPSTTRAHVVELAAGRVAPSAKPAKAAAPKKARATSKTPQSKIGDLLESKVHSGAPRRAPRKG